MTIPQHLAEIRQRAEWARVWLAEDSKRLASALELSSEWLREGVIPDDHEAQLLAILEGRES